jgi:predicted phosphodiesterase
MNKGLKEVIAQYVREAGPKEGHSDIARKLIADGHSEMTLQTVRKLVSEYRVSADDPVEVKTKEEKPAKWFVKDDHYHLYYNHAYINFPVGLVDKMFLDYSDKGKNMSSQELIQKYDLSPEHWYLIKGALRLYKKSDIFSPWTVENTPPQDLEILLEDKMSRLFRSSEMTLKVYRKSLDREYKKAIHEANFRDEEVKSFLTTFLDRTDELRPIILQSVRDAFSPVKEGLLVIADLHIGAETGADLSRTPKYNSEILNLRMDQIAHEVNARGYDKVTIVCLGDMVESFTGLNHKNSWKGVEKGKWGANVVIDTYATFNRLISSIKGFQKLYTVSGNHDRSTSDSQEDVTGEISRLVTFFLSESIGEQYVQDLGDIGSFGMGNFGLNVIPTHGHLFLSRQNAPSMCWKYGKQSVFNLILQGHLHSRIIKNGDDGIDFRKLICPSIFSGNVYSDQMGFDGSPGGYLLVEPKGNGTPRIIDESLDSFG